jgi:hypothetical protein
MISVLKTTPIEYISLWDPAVDDGALTAEQVRQYVETRDRGGEEPAGSAARHLRHPGPPMNGSLLAATAA